MHDVLDAAGLSTRAFYRHFRSRDELVLEMYRVDCERVNATLASWVADGGAIRIERDGELLTDRRYWVADLPGGEMRLACGGTHVSSIAELGAVSVELTTEQLEGAIGMTMVTTAG